MLIIENGIPANIEPKLADKLANECAVPDNSVEVNSLLWKILLIINYFTNKI